MSDDGCLFCTFRTDNCSNIGDEIWHGIGSNTFRLITLVIATLIDGYYGEAIFEDVHLVAPAVPIIRKAVDHDHQRPPTGFYVVDVNAVVFCVVVADLVNQCIVRSYQSTKPNKNEYERAPGDFCR